MIQKRTPKAFEATCINCGCTDNHACADGCYWLRVDRERRTGVCSRCPRYVAHWDRYTTNISKGARQAKPATDRATRS